MTTPPNINTADIVFVYGGLRSGTTAFRLMLDAHPKIANPGEFDFLFDHIRPDDTYPGGWIYDGTALRNDRVFISKNLNIPTVDGTPLQGLALLLSFFDQLRAASPDATVIALNVHRHAQRIADVLPESRFVHMIRDPRDVARSSIPMGWAAHVYYGVDHWIATERDWELASQALTESQHVQLRYEDLFQSPEEELSRICDYIGVTFVSEMLSYHENTSYSAPDPKLIEQWRHKCSSDDVALVEGKIGDRLAARGYTPHGNPRFPSAAERCQRALAHKLYLWKFGAKRYGLGLFIGEKITRHLRLTERHASITKRMGVIHTRSLK